MPRKYVKKGGWGGKREGAGRPRTRDLVVRPSLTGGRAKLRPPLKATGPTPDQIHQDFLRVSRRLAEMPEPEPYNDYHGDPRPLSAGQWRRLGLECELDALTNRWFEAEMRERVIKRSRRA